MKYLLFFMLIACGHNSDKGFTEEEVSEPTSTNSKEMLKIDIEDFHAWNSTVISRGLSLKAIKPTEILKTIKNLNLKTLEEFFFPRWDISSLIREDKSFNIAFTTSFQASLPIETLKNIYFVIKDSQEKIISRAKLVNQLNKDSDLEIKQKLRTHLVFPEFKASSDKKYFLSLYDLEVSENSDYFFSYRDYIKAQLSNKSHILIFGQHGLDWLKLEKPTNLEEAIHSLDPQAELDEENRIIYFKGQEKKLHWQNKVNYKTMWKSYGEIKEGVSIGEVYYFYYDIETDENGEPLFVKDQNKIEVSSLPGNQTSIRIKKMIPYYKRYNKNFRINYSYTKSTIEHCGSRREGRPCTRTSQHSGHCHQKYIFWRLDWRQEPLNKKEIETVLKINPFLQINQHNNHHSLNLIDDREAYPYEFKESVITLPPVSSYNLNKKNIPQGDNCNRSLSGYKETSRDSAPKISKGKYKSYYIVE